MEHRMERRVRRRHGVTRHHDLPTSLGGTDTVENIILLKCDKHQALHCAFGLRTIQQIINLLSGATENVGWVSFKHHQEVGNEPWRTLFGTRSKAEALTLLKRLQRCKQSPR